MGKQIKLLSYYRGIGKEIRTLCFYKAFNRDIPEARIISFGSCNFNCPYCKRGGAFQYSDGSIIQSVDVAINDIFNICDMAIDNHQIIRLSGGDPVVFPQTVLQIADYVKLKNGRLSIAHNGSSPEFITRIIPFLESAAIDLKATPKMMTVVTNLPTKIAENMYYSSLQCQKILASSGILVEIRTPIFKFNTLDDLLFLASDINQISDVGNVFWTLRIYKEITTCNFNLPNKENILWMAKEIQKLFPMLKIGIRCNWDESNFIFLKDLI